MKHPVLACAAASLAAALPGQLGQSTGEQFDAQSALATAYGGTWDGVQGVVRTLADTYVVSARRNAPTVQMRLVELDEAGVPLAAVDLPAALAGSATGLLDLAYDPAAGIVYGSCEHAVAGRQLWAFRLSTRTFDPGANVPVPASAPGAAARGLAFDRFGNAGHGTFFCVDGAGAITEFDRAGSVVRSLANPHPNATALALDDTFRLLWVFGPGGSSKSNQGVVGIAVDVQSGQANGQIVLGDPSFAGSPAGGVVTGAEFTTYAHDHTVHRLALATSANRDWVYELEGRFASGVRCGGSIGFAGDAAFGGNSAWRVTLRGSNAQSAFLMLAGARTTTTLGPPLFASGCALYLSLAPTPFLVGGTAVTAGGAQIGLPIPFGISGTVHVQWIEAPAGGLPLATSDAGSVYVRS